MEPLTIKEKKQIREERWPYFEGDKFIPLRLANELMEHDKFITMDDTREIYRYSEVEGIYENAETFIFYEAQKILDEDTGSRRLSETLNCIKNQAFTKRIELEPPIEILAIENGLLDVKKEELLPFSPELFFTSKLPIKFNKEAKCPEIEKFLTSVVAPEDYDCLLEIIGYCLCKAHPIQKAVMLVGGGSNGKSTFIALLKSFLGEGNVSSLSIQELCESRFSKGILYQKLANLYADVPQRALRDVGVFKMLVGGDQQTADVKFKQPFNFVNYAKLIFSANIVPATVDDTDAFFRRWLMITFPYKFEGENADSHILERLTTHSELSGLLNLVIKKLNLLLLAGSFSNSRSTQEIRDEYIRKSDPIGAFILDMIEQTFDGSEPKERVYNAFLDYAKERKLPIMDMSIFSKRFKMKVKISEERPTIEGKRVQSWKGILLKLEEPIGFKTQNNDQNKLNSY